MLRSAKLVVATTLVAAAAAAPADAGTILLVAGCNDASGARGFGSCLMPDDASAAPRLVSRDVAGGGFTPDGRGVVGETTGSSPAGFGNIAQVQIDGSGFRPILDAPSEAFGIRPSPDGRVVAYWLFGGAGRTGSVRLVNSDGTGDRELARGEFPRWGPEGAGIVYAGPDSELHSVRLDGTADRTITRGGNLLEATSSPDGTRVAFSALTADGTQALHVMNADGSAVRRLTIPAGQDTTPIWAPTGDALLFNRTASLADSARDLWRINLDGTGARSLTASTGFLDQFSATAWYVDPAARAAAARTAGAARTSPAARRSAAARDRTGPGVLLQGTKGGVAKRSRLQFSAYDRSGVATLDVAVDAGKSRALRRQADFKRIVKALRRGRHTLRFRSRDGAGNRRTTTAKIDLR